jgi:hypothetical protein
MPGQLPSQSESAQPDNASLKRLAKEKIRGLLDTEVTCKSGNQTMKWKVINEQVEKFGLLDFNIKEYH